MNLKELFDIIKSPDNVSKLIIVISIFIIFIFPEKIIKILNLDELIKKYGSMLGLVLIVLCEGLVVNVAEIFYKKYKDKKALKIVKQKLKEILYKLDDTSKQIILVLYHEKTYELNTFDSYVSCLRKYGIIKACNEFEPIKYSLIEDDMVAKHLYRLSEQVIKLLQSDSNLFNNLKEAFRLK